MKKKIMKRILALTIVFLMIISTPFSVFGKLYNNDIYVYASASVLEDELLKQTFIPILISSGLVFTSKEAIDDVWQKLNDYWVANDTYMKYWQHGPEDPNPDLKTVLLSVLAGQVVWDNIKETYKWIVNLPNSIWEDLKVFVDDNYDEGENYYELEGDNIYIGASDSNNYGVVSYGSYYFRNNYGFTSVKISPVPDEQSYEALLDVKIVSETGVWTDQQLAVNYGEIGTGSLVIRMSKSNGNKVIYQGGRPTVGFFTYNQQHYNYVDDDEEITYNIYGTPDIVDNSNYDWNNNYTGTKTIPIPLESDIYGNSKVDPDGMYIPSIDTEEWIGVTPDEIPNLNPSGVPNTDIPDMPIIEEPDEQTGIIIYIGNVLQLIVGQLSKIVEGVKTIVNNTNRLVFNTPSPVFNSITGEQIDPETGQPVEPSPSTEAGGGIIGDGIDTNIPTDFEWGDFRHLLDIFFIFIYFIVILILILLKFLQVVFTGLPSIAANTDLFNQYPNILEGVNYVKNLQVGGMSITVQQAFEYIFMIFFYIFVIKQIRKLYNAHVFEQSAENQRNTKDMKMDYYENSKHYESTNSWKGIEHSHNVKSNSNKYDDYENIKFTGWSDDK